MSDPFPDLTAYPRGLDGWEPEGIPQVPKGDCPAHVILPTPDKTEVRAQENLPEPARISFDEMQYYWTDAAWWNRDGDPMPAEDVGDALSPLVAALSIPNGASGTVGFDLFNPQTGGDYTSYAEIEDGFLIDFCIALPAVDLSARDSVATHIQFRNFLKDVPLLSPMNTAVIHDNIPYLYIGATERYYGHAGSYPASVIVDLVEDIVGAFVNESTADTLNTYAETYG
jgi:hypothetical protein